MRLRVEKEVRGGRPVTVVRRPKTAEEKRLEEIMERLDRLERLLLEIKREVSEIKQNV